MVNLQLLHLCDSLFPLGGFAYSDGLESATADGRVSTSADLREWIDVCLDETIARLEGPAVWRAWQAANTEDWCALAALDDEVTALRPSSAARQSSRAMGTRLLASWATLHPDRRLERVGNRPLPIAFACACMMAGVNRRDTVGAFAYTRLAAATSAAMRLMPVGQTGAHTVLARALGRVPAIVAAIAARDGRIESFTPEMDIAAMGQQYLHSRLFRS